MIFNDAGFQLLKSFEGCELRAYQDISGLWTIGYGHRLSAYDGCVIDEAEAQEFLSSDVLLVSSYVTDLLKRELDSCEFSAVVCLAYNVGVGRLAKSRTLSLVNADQDPTREWLGFDYAGGKEVSGLLRRRQAELALYFSL